LKLEWWVSLLVQESGEKRPVTRDDDDSSSNNNNNDKNNNNVIIIIGRIIVADYSQIAAVVTLKP